MRFVLHLVAPVLMPVCWLTSVSADDQPAVAKKPVLADAKQRLFKISKETTYLEAPLTADGFVNYTKAIEDENGKGVTPENNFAVVYWQAVGPAEIEPPMRERFFEKLGIAPVPEAGDYYVTLSEMRERLHAQDPNAERDIFDQQGRAQEGPWSAQDSPELAEWLRINGKHLDRLAEATGRTRFFSPIPMVDEDESPPVIAILLPALQGMRDVARGFQARAMLRLNAGDVDGAWNDLRACHRLGRLAAQDPSLIGILVGIAIDSIAFQSDIYLVQHRGLTAAQTRRIRQDFRKLSSLPPMVEKINRLERFMCLDCIAMIARGKLNTLDLVDEGAPATAMTKLFTNALIDWNVVLEMSNDWYDQIVEAAQQPTFAKRKAAFAELDAAMQKMRAEVNDPLKFATSFFAFRSPRRTISEKVGHVIMALLTPAMEAAKEAENRSTMRTHLIDIAFALAAYRVENGRYPEKLGALLPNFLAELPQDLYSSEDLVYRTNGDNYLLYSVGINLNDDEGQTFDSQPPGDDIVVNTFPPVRKVGGD